MRTPRVLLGALAVTAVVAAACSSGAAPAQSAAAVPTHLPAPTANPDAATLTGGTWNLVEFTADSGLKIGGDLNPTITFAEDGKVSGVAACNTYTSSYTVQGDALTIQPAATTAMACPTEVGTKFESAYLQALANVRAYIIDLKDGVNMLTLGDASGQTLMRYTLADTTITGVTWTATGINNGKQAVTSVSAGSTVTLLLDGKGNASGNAGCNTYNGTYTLDGSGISFGPLATTRMACASEDVNTQEQAYLAALANTKTWDLHNGVLTFRDAGGATQVDYTQAR